MSGDVVTSVELTDAGRQANAEIPAESHVTTTLDRRVVSGKVRQDADWMEAIQAALQKIFANGDDLQACAQAVDEAMMRGIHAAARTGAVHELGLQVLHSTDPARQAEWDERGAPAAAERAERFNSDQAARAAEEE